VIRRIVAAVLGALVNLMIDTADFATDYPFGTREDRNRRS
jgi:hypothetical protein